MCALTDQFEDYVKANKFPIKIVKISGFYDVVTKVGFDPTTMEREFYITSYDSEDKLICVEQKPEGTYLQLLKYHTLKEVVPDHKEYKSETFCSHNYIDVGFQFSKFVCRFCDKERGY